MSFFNSRAVSPILYTGTSHSARKPSEYASPADSTVIYFERLDWMGKGTGKIIAVQTSGLVRDDEKIGFVEEFIADQSRRTLGEGRIIGFTSSALTAGTIPTNKVPFYVYK